MACGVFCNRCFQPPRRTSSFSLTNCGHVYCDVCLAKGRKGECLICKVPCHMVLLSKHTDWHIQAFFMGIDRLCKKYSKETSQISEFQDKHRKRLLAFYREKISKLEESLQKSALQIEQLQRVESMEVDLTPSPMRKPEIAAGPTRISLISPPQDGRMGGISHRGPQRPSLTPHLASVPPAPSRVPPLQIPGKGLSPAPAPLVPGGGRRGGTPSLGGAQTTSQHLGAAAEAALRVRRPWESHTQGERGPAPRLC
ncbi:probable E3 SUMO-protein ligase RNF212 isoform X5 [Manis pentadactyla]|uniref:probable E3 SUMO-protein ligase RNF212 isoform X5 n=1 Tax=Manis pentadactyla TaxID=143292 RepID=UPI00255CAE2D|nr:probable E3 SUMO-protein ligase RNF212 isoform X5 [Manis pentadactyla]